MLNRPGRWHPADPEIENPQEIVWDGKIVMVIDAEYWRNAWGVVISLPGTFAKGIKVCNNREKSYNHCKSRSQKKVISERKILWKSYL